MLRPLLLFVISIATAAGCAKSSSDQPPPAVASLPYEITENPRVLLQPDVPIDQLTLRGIKLGDDESAIPVSKIIDKSNLGWIRTRDLCRYRVINGKVVTLGCWDRKVLDQLGVAGEDDVERAFGKPEEKYQISTSNVTFRYQDAKKRVIWNRFEPRLVAINIGRPESEPATQEDPESKR